MEHLKEFQGVSGALIVSLIAFTIVFLVLAGLTGVIYAMRLFAGESEKKDSNPPSASSNNTVAPVSAPASSTADKGRVAAVISAAILAATHGRGRILSIAQEGYLRAASSSLAESTRTWRSVGILERVSGRLMRSWKN